MDIKMTTTFENAKVGDPVWCALRGHGSIVSVDWKSSSPIRVDFEGGHHLSYDSEGKYFDCWNRTLFWQERKWQGETPTQPEPKPEPKPNYQLNDPILVRCYDDSEWVVRHFKELTATGKVVCFNDGLTSYSGGGYYSEWNQHKPLMR